MMDKPDLASMTLAEITALLPQINVSEKYRAAQIFAWIHEHNAQQFAEMTNLPQALRARLDETVRIAPVNPAEKWVSAVDGTIKYLFNLANNTIIESVHMHYSHGNILCISTQAGCRMGCRFCASTVGGLVRNLTAGEMCGQIYAAQRDTGQRIDGVVLMGCGEPLDNFDQTVRFIALMNHPRGIGQRHITVSTCGLVPQMRQLADMHLQITLAVSLHAPDDALRKTLMPIAARYTIADVLAACQYYIQQTHRRITFEYALIANINDDIHCAAALAELLRGMLCHVNLIPVNETSAPLYKAQEAGMPSGSRKKQYDAFAQVLMRHKIPVTLRRATGRDIQAACGQLRARRMGSYEV